MADYPRSPQRSEKQYVTEEDRTRFRKEAELEYKDIDSVGKADRALSRLTNPSLPARGLNWLFEKIGNLVNFAKVVVLSVFLGRQETSKRIYVGNLEAEKQKQKDQAKKEIKTQVLQEKLEQCKEEEERKKEELAEKVQKKLNGIKFKENFDNTKDYSITKTQFAMQVEHASDYYKKGLAEFLGKQLGIDPKDIVIGNDKDAKGQDRMNVLVTLSTGKALQIQIDEYGQWSLPNEPDKSMELQALAGEIRKGIMFYTASEYDQTQDAEYNHITRDVTKEDGTVKKEPLIGKDFNKIPTGIMISRERIEATLHALFEKGGVIKNKDFSIPLVYERKDDTIVVKLGSKDKSPLLVTKDNIQEMIDKILERAEKYIDLSQAKFALNEEYLKSFLEEAEKVSEKELSAEMKKVLGQQFDQIFQRGENELDRKREPEPEKMPEREAIPEPETVPEPDSTETGTSNADTGVHPEQQPEKTEEQDQTVWRDPDEEFFSPFEPAFAGVVSELSDDGTIPEHGNFPAENVERSFSPEIPVLPDTEKDFDIAD